MEENKKYKLTDETIEVEGKTLYRIESLKDFRYVLKGEKGGFIESECGETFKQGIPFIERLAFASHVEIDSKFDMPNATQVITDSARIYIPTEDLVDFEKELERLRRELTVCEKEKAVIEGKLNNENFVSRAPQNVVEAERQKLAKILDRFEKVQESIAKIVKE